MNAPKLPALPLSAWPELDRHRWEEGQQELLKLNNKNQRVVQADYGCFLWFLSQNGELDTSILPASRVTPDRARRYAMSLRESGYPTRMVYNKTWSLRKALRAMQPGCEVSIVNHLGRKRYDEATRRRIRSRQRLPVPKLRRNPLDLWPEIDRDLWERGLQPQSLLDGPSWKPLRPDTIDIIVKDYSHWLKFLNSRGRLDHTIKPSERLSRLTVGDYVAGMLEAGRSSNTIIGRLYRLRSALTRMEPDLSLRWLTWPNGRSLLSQLPKSKPRKRPVVESRVLYNWGLQLIMDSETVGGPLRTTILRDGLMIALFAARAPRLTSMSRLRVGGNLTRIGNAFRLNLEMDDLKAGDSVEYDLPESLTAAFERYLATRSELAGARTHEFLWVTQQGSQLGRAGIKCMVGHRSRQRFGFSFGPHRFRHALGTSAALHDPDHPGVAPAIMNNSSRMVEKHYNLSDTSHSAARFHKSLRDIRANTKSLAAREFRKRRKRRP